jgi:hypothetical protein
VRPTLQRLSDAQAGLAVMIAVLVLAVAMLFFDDWLLRTGRETITQWVTDDTPWHAAVGWGMVAVLCLIPGGLAFHFATYRR